MSREEFHIEGRTSTKRKETRFVDFVFAKIAQDKGVAARLRRADNPSTEYQSWEILAPWVDLENSFERIPYAVIAAAIARSNATRNGTLSLGQALAKSFEIKNKDVHDSPANARLRRLLAASDSVEVCRIIRPMLQLIDSRVLEPINYARLLSELRYFGERSKLRWAQDFYRQPA